MKNGRITKVELADALHAAVAAEITTLDERSIDAIGGAAVGTRIDDNGSNQSTLGYVDPETTGQHNSSY